MADCQRHISAGGIKDAEFLAMQFNQHMKTIVLTFTTLVSFVFIKHLMFEEGKLYQNTFLNT